MISAEQICKNANEYTGVTTCYLKGFWGQPLTEAEYARVLKMYPDNAKYDNAKYVGSNAYAFDCICFIKSLVSLGKVGKRCTYADLSKSALGDCTTQEFLSSLYDCCDPQSAPAGYGLATSGHAALSLGNGMWIDANKNATQNGIKIHTSGIERFTRAGKIKGVDYATPEPIIPTERKVLEDFASWLIDMYVNR